ncbi:uncharacterized protein LOC126839679 [Adelges cooleyi]|uniref:uncharacterized protein LOC126839679 n=1 Tax=Adelges cooleyi TaxID=133065 RepID=UPI00218079AE|nr:uncharacterized protein LOC126839679 [Adelges cooleyi]
MPSTSGLGRQAEQQFWGSADDETFVQAENNMASTSRVATGVDKRSLEELCDSEGDEACLQALDSITGNRENNANNKRLKSHRLAAVTREGFVLTTTGFRGLCKAYYKKKFNQLADYESFLAETKPQLIELLTTLVAENAIKYTLKLESTYKIPSTEVLENRAFKTCARTLLPETIIEDQITDDFNKLLVEEEDMAGKGSGFSLEKIDGILVDVFQYSPFGGSSYIPLPEAIENRKATVNVQNTDQQCFRYSILAKHVTTANPHRVTHYEGMTDRYNFAGISFPTPLSEAKKFEKNNKEVSINVYGFKKGNRTYKNKAKNNIPNHNNEKKDYIIIPYRVCTIEQPNHFDLLYFDDGKGNFHYCYIRNLTRLVGQQMSKNNKEKAICRRCFKTYVDEAGKAQKESRLDEHRRICNKNESVTPILPPPKTYMKFENYGNTQKHDL